jgi:hypothetical protein
MSMNKPDIEQIQRAVATSLHEHWVLFLVEGIILIILGLAAVVIPPIATLAVEILYGWLFLISGIVGLITTFRMRQAPGFWWSLVSVIAYFPGHFGTSGKNHQWASVFACGLVRYSDVFGNHYLSGFCYVFNAHSNRFYAIGGANHNYRRKLTEDENREGRGPACRS